MTTPSSMQAPVPIIPARDRTLPRPLYSPPDASVLPMPLSHQLFAPHAHGAGSEMTSGSGPRRALTVRALSIAGGAVVVITAVLWIIAQRQPPSEWVTDEPLPAEPVYTEEPMVPGPTEAPVPDAVPQGPIEALVGSKDALEEQIRVQLQAEGLGDVTVEIDDDAIAWVGGSVASDVDRERAINLVASQAGIREVRYEVNVGGSQPQETAPAEWPPAEGEGAAQPDVAPLFNFADAYTQVLREQGFGQVEVSIGAQGELILGGSVRNQDEHAALYETLAVLAPGVAVVDQLAIEYQ